MSDVPCGRCGQATDPESTYCASCGFELHSAQRNHGQDEATSEAVRPPEFGETGPPVVAGAPSVAAPTESVPTPAYGVTVPNATATTSSEFVTLPSSGPRRSTSVMIAALVVAAVVIVGGGLILVLSGGDDQQTGDSIVAPAATTASASTTPDTVPPTASSSDVATTIATTTVAAAPVSTLPPATLPPTTVPPPLPTAAPPPPSVVVPPVEPVRGPGDLGLSQPILNEPCDGRYITFVGSAVGDRPYADVVTQLLASYPGSNYIWTKSCPSLRQVFQDGSDIYGVVFGPYGTAAEACDARRSGPPDAYVRRISTTDPQDHMIDC